MTWQCLILILEPPKILRSLLNTNTHRGQEKPYTAEIIKASFFEDTLNNYTTKVALNNIVSHTILCIQAYFTSQVQSSLSSS